MSAELFYRSNKFMLRFLIFLFPAMLDVTVGAIIFITTVRLVKSGETAFDSTLAATAWALGHSFFSFLVAKINSSHNAAYRISAGCGVILLGLLLLIFFPDPKIQLYWTLIIGLGTALFFCSFQVFMKASDRDVHAGLVRSTALYGFAWSCGIASGPFITSFVWGKLFPENGWIYCHWINVVLVSCVGIAIWPLKHYIDNLHKNTPAPVQIESPTRVNYSKLPDLVWIGWLTAGVGCITVALIRTIFPYKAEIINISKTDLGYITALVSYSQGFFSLLLLKSRYWMYKAVPMGLFSLCGFASMIMFSFGTSLWIFYIAAIIYGIYSSSFFFCLVFHSLVHPEKSGKYVSWNEVIVGITGILAPLAGGVVIDLSNNHNLPFLIGALIIVSVIVVQFIRLRKIDPELVK
jgi:MFS family permease